MLSLVPLPPIPLGNQAYFLDHLNRHIYYLKDGLLHLYDLTTNKQHPISLHLSPIQPQRQPKPVLITLSGETINNTDRNILTGNTQEVTVRASLEVKEGSHWQWHVPLVPSSIQLGLCKLKDQEILSYQLISFNSSTSRTISFTFKQSQLSVWVNGTVPNKKSTKAIEYDPSIHKLYPCARLKGKGSTIIFIPFLTTNITEISFFNPFGALYLQEPKSEQEIHQQPINQTKIEKLIHLSSDRMLVLWKNSKIQVITRNQETKQFNFSTASIYNNGVFQLFSKKEYGLLKEWRGEKNLFKWSNESSIQNTYHWIRFLISTLDDQRSQRIDIYCLLLKKLLFIRPYLYSVGLTVPNLTLNFNSDISGFSSALKYFEGYSRFKKLAPLLLDEMTSLTIEGTIKDVTPNYLLSKTINTIIIYHLGHTIKQVLRETISRNHTFSKGTLVQSFQESDVRYLQQESSFLYKILTSSLSKKKQQETHIANPNDVQQLIKDFGIEEHLAIQALQNTGNLEQALVWIYSQRKDDQGVNAEGGKDENEIRDQSVQMIEINTIFTRLLVSVNKHLFVVGLLPGQIATWIYRGENEYIDLGTFKHEHSLESIPFEHWYKGDNHPHLHLLDSIQLTQSSEILFKKSKQLYYIYSAQGLLYQQQINFNFQHIYEALPSLALSEAAPLDPQFQKANLYRSIQGELASILSNQSSFDKIVSTLCNQPSYEPNTTILINKKIYSNSNCNAFSALRLVIRVNESLLEQPIGSAKSIPLTIEYSPPGVNKNYSISNILVPNGSFLANYPHGLRMRHLHHLLMHFNTITVKRCLNRKHVNNIEEGKVYFTDLWGHSSKPYPFQFEPHSEEATIILTERQFWKEIVLEPKFTTLKKLPFQIGSIYAEGSCLSSEEYIRQNSQSISKFLKQEFGQPLSLLAFTLLSIDTIQVDISTADLQLQSEWPSSAKMQVLSSSGVSIPETTVDGFQFLKGTTPPHLIKFLLENNDRLDKFLQYLSRSHSFTLHNLVESDIKTFVQKVVVGPQKIQGDEYYQCMFSKIWENKYAKQYLLEAVQSLSRTPLIPLQFLKLILTKLTPHNHHSILQSALTAIKQLRCKEYDFLTIEQPYLYFQSQFYSDYYFGLLEPSKKEKQDAIFSQPLIKCDIAVLKSDYTKTLKLKLPTEHVITNTMLRVERCETSCKVHYSVYKVTEKGKELVNSGSIQQHQWVQIAKMPYQEEIQEVPESGSGYLNIIGLELGAFLAQYLEIQLHFTETGIIAHQTQVTKIPQIDILPQLYGYSTGKTQSLPSFDDFFDFDIQDMFFLSVTSITKQPLKKYSISKPKNIELLYYTPHHDDLAALTASLQQKIEKKDFQAIVSFQRRLINNRHFSFKLSLDYLYTLVALSLTELQHLNITLEGQVCESIFVTLVKAAQGPIKIIGFKSISHKINLLIKSLQFIEQEVASLGSISFSYQQLIDVIDFNNSDLCKSLTRLILRGVPYQQKWAELLIKMSPLTQAHKQIITYFATHEDWLKNNYILSYLISLSDEIFINHFLDSISYTHLSKLVLTPTAKPKLDMLLEVVVERASETNLVDLDVVSLIFQQEEVRWEQLQRVISSCPQATDIVVHQFLQSDTPQLLASQHNLLFITAASPKYAEQFASFLGTIYQKNKSILTELFLGLIGKCSTLHYDFLETIGRFLSELCNFGGIEGVRMVTDEGVASLQVAVQMLKVIQKLPEGAQLPHEDLFIDWYLSNNDYQLIPVSPASKSPAYYLMTHLTDQVLSLLKTSNPPKVLSKYAASLNTMKQSKKLSLIKRHLLFNQIHHGASVLLSHTLTPGSLANVFVGPQTPLLTTVINSLKASLLRRSTTKASKWSPSREVDLTEKFKVNEIEQVKNLQTGKDGSKAPAFKVPITQRHLKMECEQSQSPTKFVIGFCLNDHAQNKTAILPSRVELFGGNERALFKIGQMTLLEDQFYLSFGVRLFGLNLNSPHSQGINPTKSIQFRLHEPQLSSVSQVLENSQKTKKGATFNISFVSVQGYDSEPIQDPDSSQLYVTLLGFLSQPKYQGDLKGVLSSVHFDQKLQLIIQVLNDLLPNQQIEELLLALNREGENILEHVLRSKGANSRLVNLLILGKLTKDNINKLIAYTLTNISLEYVNIVTLSLRLASYSLPTSNPADTLENFDNIKLLIEKYEQAKNEAKGLYMQLINSLLTVPNLYHYDISKLVSYIWTKPQRHRFYPLLAATLPYYPSHLETFSSNNYALQLFNQLRVILSENQQLNSVASEPFNHLALLCTLALNNSCREQLLQKKAPILMVELLKCSSSILVKYNNETMNLFIGFFQTTCIDTNCQDEFGQILISLMTSLNNFNPIHHNYFIHSFFFPLINAFNGVPLIIAWKYNNTYLKQVTDVLQSKPIRSNIKVICYQEKYYHPIESIDQFSLNHSLLFLEKSTDSIVYRLSQKTLYESSTKQQRKYEFKEGKVIIYKSLTDTITLLPQTYKVYEQNEWEKHLLTNSTLISLDNPWILDDKYHGVLPLKQSTPQRSYFVPQQMKVSQLLKLINVGGFRIHTSDLPNIAVNNYLTNKPLSQSSTLKEALKHQKQPYLKLQIEASQLFTNTTIETLAKEDFVTDPFIPQQTIFKAFEQKKGLQKMITVLKGCVKNWTNAQQSNIWGQYLKELESYSCFPVFSSLYINRQSNVGLLFDLLLGLPDKQDNKKWTQKEKESVKELYSIIKDVFAVKGDQARIVRQYALKSQFYSTMLDRLYLITKEPRRFKNEEQEEEKEAQDQVMPSLEKKNSEQEYKTRLQKRKGVGYGTDSSTNQKWDVTGQEQARKEKSDQILSLLKILQQFFDCQEFNYPSQILDQTYESSLLPILQCSFRGGSLLQISKYAQLFQGQLSFIQVVAKCKHLVPTLMPLPKLYEPKQSQSLHSLLKTLANTSKIFLSCLTGQASQKVSQEIAKKIMVTFELVEEAVSHYQTTHNDQQEQKKIMELPLQKKYPLLLKDLRFDYIDMKDSSGKISKHHYASNYQAGHKPPVDKTIRLAQELADLSHALPIDHTNAIFVRCDKERVDFFQALVMGSNGTPYGHGAYLFDIYFQDTYPNSPPKVNLMTTGNGQIRFNPNLYACGKVCLSLLGTWRGNAMQNWDAKVSTLLQVLVSIQSIIMSEDIYFNEPGFQHEQGTPEGEKKNQAYANIVRYGNVKFAMTDNIKSPPKGFESVIRRHFYLKKDEIMEQCNRWLKFAQKRQASYNGLVSDHNYNWCNNFKKSKTEYKTMLQKAVRQLQTELNKLPPPTHSDFQKELSSTKPKKNPKLPKDSSQDTYFQQIDVSYGKMQELKELDMNDEKVKDRWSRYIGAMGVEAVTKQSKANIALLGIGAVGVEIAKNIVLSGCKELAIWDDKTVKWPDLSGQFFLGESDIDKPRLESTFYKLQELNHYVKMSKLQYHPDDLSNFNHFQVVIATERNQQELIKLNAHCRSKNIHFLSVDCYGPYGQIFNDFGDNFEVLDKDGEDTVEVLIDQITISDKGVLTLPKGLRHPFSDGDSVRILGVKGMKSLTNESESINETLHKIKVINPNSFEIGDTTSYSPYEGQGTVRNIKTPTKISFKSLETCVQLQNIDSNLEYYDWSKSGKLKLVHSALLALSDFTSQHLRLPLSWNKQDANAFVEIVKKKRQNLNEDQVKYLQIFSYTCSGTFGSICAFFGGLAAQETFKAITGKYTPVNQYFIAEFSQIIQLPPDDEQGWNEYVSLRLPVDNRTEGLRRIIGGTLLNRLQNAKIFMVGSGAIGCELLKNFAMLELGAGDQGGSIVVTDPDHIETSNLNRQFLFREKHLRKPKSATAAAAVVQMNPRLKGHIKARLDKVCEATKDVFSSEFFEGLTIVANALDNVEARRYVDSRCVESKIPLLQSGTLSSKGHVQVIIPYKTETYGSMQDPNDAQGDIPHCTLKMFPEETLHCVQWARDLFGKQFTLGPKALKKLLDEGENYVAGPSDVQMLRDCLKLVEKRPITFEDAIEAATKLFYQLFRNDILQLLYTYPLDSITKDGKPFWKLPKRPPVPIEQIDPVNPLHNTFISSYSVLLAKVHKIPFPKDFRVNEKRQQITKTATLIKVDPFVPSDQLAQQMTEEVNNDALGKEGNIPQENQQKPEGEQGSAQSIYTKFKTILKEIKESGESVESKHEDFQKDDDQNGHIDLIYSMANLRACNYKLQIMDWITVKLKAGRIMPALSTTTSCIAALQTIQLVKYLRSCPLDSMRNSFLNLAVPSLTMGQPGPVQKIKVHEGLETNIWQRWTIGPLSKSKTIGEFMKATQEKYKITVKGLTLLEGGQIYSDFVMSLQSKKQEKEKLLKKQLQALLIDEVGDEASKQVDFTLVMGVGEILIKHAPTLRLLLQP